MSLDNPKFSQFNILTYNPNARSRKCSHLRNGVRMGSRKGTDTDTENCI